MAREFRCMCGNLLQAKDDWAGRQAKCPKCGKTLTIPGPQALPPLQPSGVADLLDAEISSQLTTPAAPQAPSRRPEPEKAPSWTGRMARALKKLPGLRSIVFKWREPAMYRVRLRGDVLRRLAVILAAFLIPAGLMLVVHAGKSDWGDAVAAAVVFGLCFGILPASIAVFLLRSHASGSITIRKEDVYRSRDYSSITGGWHEWSTWPYEAISRCVIVPAEALGKSFSVMVLTIEHKREIVGIPKKTDLEKLGEFFRSRDVPVEYGRSVPAEFTKKMDLKICLGIGAVGAACFLVGLGAFADKGGLADAEQADAVADVRDRAREVLDKFEEDLERIGPGADDGPIGFRQPSLREMTTPGAKSEPSKQTQADDSGPAPSSTPMPPLPTRPSRRSPRDFPRGFDEGEPPPGETMPFPPRPGVTIPFRQPPTLPGSPTPRPSLPPHPTAPAAPTQPGDTELVGGSGGGPFRTISPDRQPVLGFQCSMGSWAGQPALRQIDPLFARDPPRRPGQTVLAREGYAVGALNVDAAAYVQAVQIVFMRVTPDGRLDPNDSYTSDWIGDPTGNPTKTLGGTGAKVIGVHGRRAAVFDAVGLVLEEP